MSRFSPSKPLNPILRESFENNWFYPWQPSGDVPDGYKIAQDEGWAEWVETPLDIEAIKHGYVYDLSRDHDGNPCYWYDGKWVLHDGTTVPVHHEGEAIGHIGRGDQMLRFSEVFLRHTKGSISGQPYRFLPWQRKICATIFGWVKSTSRYRRYSQGYITVAKKSGKSALMSVISLYQLIGEGLPKSYTFSCACDRNQARIIYDEAANMVRESPKLSELITIIDSKGRLVHQESGSYYQVLSADAHRNDGYDGQCVLIDEIHRHPNRKLYTVMKRAGLAREEPLNLTITTYGPSLSDGSIWAEIHSEAKAQLEGRRPKTWRNYVFIASAEPIPVVAQETVKAGQTIIPVQRLQQPVDTGTISFDLTQFHEEDATVDVEIVEPAKRYQDHIKIKPIERDIPAFSEAEANTDWRSDHAIRCANPSVGVVFPMDKIRKEIEDARSPEAEAETKQLNLNIVSGSGRKWISTAAWLACAGKFQVQPKHLTGRHCYGGLDVSFGNDLIGFGLAFPNWDVGMGLESVEKPRVDLLTWAWVPSFMLDEREEVEQFPYRHYSRQSYLIDGQGPIRICDGQVINFPQVASEIIAICSFFQVVAIGYDPNYASFVVPTLEQEGITCVSHRQGAVSMSPPCKRFSQGVYDGWIAHGSNPVLDRAIEGAQLHPPDKAGNTYLSKGSSKVRIDPLVAQVMAVGFACDPPQGADLAYTGPGTGMWG
jgi:phage terminase large subunit-like protein